MAADADDRWAMHAAERALLGNKSSATRLGFAVLLKLFQAEGRFPRRAEDVPLAAVEAIAAQVGVPAAAWHGYAWQGRTIEYHRARVRAALGYREATLDDAEALGRWLDGRVLALERRHDRLIAAARERCWVLRLEPPSPDRLERLVRSALRRREEAFGAAVLARLSPGMATGPDALLKSSDVGSSPCWRYASTRRTLRRAETVEARGPQRKSCRGPCPSHLHWWGQPVFPDGHRSDCQRAVGRTLAVDHNLRAGLERRAV